ncbi:MAG TPA: ABC transporter ATP-binding protein [Kofleriaceae bacterium]|nr:ABC transporter ATP-binding protein [Kofleriaceae bacterium]
MRIELSGVRKRYGKVVALDGVDLDVPSGARVALIGANGSGKTTLTRVVMGLIRHEGVLKLGGAPAVPRSLSLAQRIAYVPQIAPPWAAPVGDVVAAVGALRGVPRERFAQMGERLGVHLDSINRRAFRSLSGGTKQKVLLALALAAPASLVILDEPTASLDAAARRRFFDVADQALGDATVLLCSHRLDELRTMVDHVAVLAEGKVAWSGPAEKYLADHTAATIAVRVDTGDDAWLRAHGFARGAGGWWRRTANATEKLALVPQALAALGARVRDLAIHDTEKLDA